MTTNTKDALDDKVLKIFDGKVVRKDLLHRIKKGTNVPTFVLEFFLARFCASDDPEEIKAGTEAVLETLKDNYVRPDEANAAQSRVAIQGKHRFIDKIHVRYVEKDKRHWAALENFNSQKISINEKFFADHKRMLEGGIWAEVTVAHSELDDEFAFYVEDVRPIQLSRFDFEGYCEGRKQFTRDEWLSVILRAVGLEPAAIDHRVKMHFLLRLAPLVEQNYNFIELGPRGTGKSYFYSEFSPYSTLVSGGQASKATLFYNNARKQVGLVGFWDNVAFDEVAGIRIRDPEAIQIMKDFMANGRFSRGTEIIADASLSFVGNIDESVEQLVASPDHDLFISLPKELDLAVMDRFACYLPGWEMPKNSTSFLTNNYGLITDYLAEAFHHCFSATNRYEEVSSRIKLGSSVEGRDEKGIKKTVCAYLKMLHPDGSPSDEEFDEYVAYAVEMRRRVKEQMNKRKPDDEFANINLSYFNKDGKEVVVYCPESKGVSEVQQPTKPSTSGDSAETTSTTTPVQPITDTPVAESTEPKEQHFKIRYGETGHSYETIIAPYLAGAKEVVIEDAYIRKTHQVGNLVRLCEAITKQPTIKKIVLVTKFDNNEELAEVQPKLEDLQQSLLDFDVALDIKISPELHDREIRIDNGWIIKIGRGLDFYQAPDSYFDIGSNDLTLRKCRETNVDIFKSPNS
ncbi:MAG: BREX system Lon protease-like protein BrxL [Planctomycetota bacterium]